MADYLYKEGDVVRFMSAKPGIHFMEFIGADFDPSEIEPDEYIGIIFSTCMDKSYLLQTESGQICVEPEGNILGKVDEKDIPEKFRGADMDPFNLKNITYNVPEEERACTTDVKDHCENLAHMAMKALFPEEKVAYLNFRNSSFIKSDILADLDWILEMNKDYINEESYKLREEYAEFIGSKLFKEYYELECGMAAGDDCIYNFMIAIDKDFKTVIIARNIDERTSFFRSLGPEFNDAYDAKIHFARMVYGKWKKE